ncbi:MAG: hypothetical protein ACJ790_09205 [Myxococcaceae bacterium]
MKELSGSALAARALALCWLVGGHAFFFPGVFLPFVPLPVPPNSARLLFIALSVLSSAAIVLGVQLRKACVLLGATVLVATLLSRAYFSNNRLFFAVLMLVFGIAEGNDVRWAVRGELALLYFGAGLDKLLSAEWRSGEVLSTLAAGLLKSGHLYLPINRSFGPHPLGDALSFFTSQTVAQLCSIGVIGIELVLAGAFAFGFVRSALLLHCALQCGIVLFLGSTMGVFFQACFAAAIPFLGEPETARKRTATAGCVLGAFAFSSTPLATPWTIVVVFVLSAFAAWRWSAPTSAVRNATARGTAPEAG